MTERAYDRTIRKQEAEDRARLEAAVRKIETAPDLRFLFARMFEACGMAASPFHPDPLTTAHACGKMAVGEELRALLETYSPALYFDLMKEHADAERQRNASLADKLAAD
jgi:hypothetical protein